jgi:hypothetical protein
MDQYPDAYLRALGDVAQRGTASWTFATLREAQSRRMDLYRFFAAVHRSVEPLAIAHKRAARETTVRIESHLDGRATLIMERNAMSVAVDGKSASTPIPTTPHGATRAPMPTQEE